MSGRLPGKVAVVFGGGAVGPGWGNGKASAVKYAREGARVAVIDIDLAAARETAEIIQGEDGQARAYECDISNEPWIGRLIPEIIREFGRIDILHNNVGAPIMGSVEDMPNADWDRAQDLNLKGAFMTCRAVLPHMKANRAGVITNISSIAAIRHTGYSYAAYYAGKGD